MVKTTRKSQSSIVAATQDNLSTYFSWTLESTLWLLDVIAKDEAKLYHAYRGRKKSGGKPKAIVSKEIADKLNAVYGLDILDTQVKSRLKRLDELYTGALDILRATGEGIDDIDKKLGIKTIHG